MSETDQRQVTENHLPLIINMRMSVGAWHPNMPLRGLFYFSQQYEGLIGAENADVYGSKRVPLPTPEYIMFYNGGGMKEDRSQRTHSGLYGRRDFRNKDYRKNPKDFFPGRRDSPKLLWNVWKIKPATGF